MSDIELSISIFIINTNRTVCGMEYECKECNYKTVLKYNWHRHIKSKKHIQSLLSTKQYYSLYLELVNSNIKRLNKRNIGSSYNNIIFLCECGRMYTRRSNLSRHQKKCEFSPEYIEIEREKILKWVSGVRISNTYSNNIDNSNSKLLKKWMSIASYEDNEIEVLREDMKELKYGLTKMCDLVSDLTKLNEELHDKMDENKKEVSKIAANSVANSNVQSHHSSSYNTYNNINIITFLNTERKDALNLSEFVDSLEMSLSDLEFLKSRGFVHSIQDALIDRLKELDHTKRPIHCTDKKRKKFYVKNDDVWKIDTEHKEVYSALNKMTNKHCKLLSEWKRKHPDWLDSIDGQDVVSNITKEICKLYDDKERRLILVRLSEIRVY